MTPHFKYVCCGGLWKPIVGMPLKTVATSFKPNGNPQNEEIHGDEVGNYEVAQFFFFLFYVPPNSNPISVYLEYSTALKPIATELQDCNDCEGGHNTREPNLGISRHQLVNYWNQPLPHRIAHSMGANQETLVH